MQDLHLKIIYIYKDLASKFNLSPSVASAAVRPKAVFLLLFIHSLLLLPMFVEHLSSVLDL